MLVCVGAALFMIVSFCGFADVLSKEHVELDPSRIAAQVVSGIGSSGPARSCCGVKWCAA
jgi:putative Mg2+ transporter-C (MgtC) family protein